MAAPVKLAHVVLRTGQLEQMLDWYLEVLEGTVTFANEGIAFLTYDDEHHRVAIANTGATEKPGDQHTGMHHFAFTYASLGDLLGTYQRLKNLGIQPFWTINHGPTTSMYYADPDGNYIELQVDNFETEQQLQQFFDSGAFAENPIGVEFDAAELCARFESGEPVADLVKRP